MAKVRTGKFRYLCVALILAALCYGLISFRLPFWVAGLYFAMGLVSFTLYGFDKSAARGTRRRIPERTLLAVDLVFGIMGGLLGQQLFRHKTQKPVFIGTSLAFTALHILVIFAVIAESDTLARSFLR